MNSHQKSMVEGVEHRSSEDHSRHLHRGRIVELVIRRNSASISDVARALQVSRRTLYNWFKTENLDFKIICKIGYILNHDFTKEFPQELPERLKAINLETLDLGKDIDKNGDPIYYWMTRYIKLLEAFNEKLMSVKKTNPMV